MTENTKKISFEEIKQLFSKLPQGVEKDVFERVTEGINFFESKNYEMATDTFAELVQIYSNVAGLRFLLGTSLSKKGNHEAAVINFRRLISLAPNYINGYYILADELVKLRNEDAYAEAETLLRYLMENSKFKESETLNALAAVFYLQKKYGEALKIVEQILEDTPNDLLAWHTKGLCLEAMGEKQEAEQAYRKIIALNSSWHCVWNNLGILLSEQSRYEEAEKSFLKAIELNPENGEYLYNLATCCAGQGRLNDAFQYCYKAWEISQQPQIAKFFEELVWRLKATTDWGLLKEVERLESDQWLESKTDEAGMAVLAGNLERLKELSQEFIECQESLRKAYGYIFRGFYLLRFQQFEQAEQAYRQAIALNPDLRGAWNGLVNSLLEQRKAGEALNEIEKRLLVEPNFVPLQAMKGSALTDLGRLEEAETILRRLIENNEEARKRAATWNNFGFVLEEQEKFEEAVEMYKQAFKLDPGNWKACSNLIRCLYYNLSRFEESLEYADKIPPIVPPFFTREFSSLVTEIRNSFAELSQDKETQKNQFLNAGNKYFLEKNYPAARVLYSRMLVLDSMDAHAHFIIGITWLEQGKPQRAEPYFKRAWELNPSYLYYGFHYGCCLRYNFKYQEAVVMLSEVLKSENQLDPHAQIACRNHLAYSLCGLKKYDEALEVSQVLIDNNKAIFEIWLTRGMCYLKLEKWSEAEEASRIALKQDPSERKSIGGEDLGDFTWLNLGKALSHQNRFAEAKEALFKALEINPLNFTAYYELSQCYSKTEEYSKSLAVSQVAADTNPQFLPAHKQIIDFMARTPHEFSLPAFIRALSGLLGLEIKANNQERVKEIERLIYQVCCSNPILGYIGHMYFTGHWQVANELLLEWKDYIKGPLLDVGCGTGGEVLFLSLLCELKLLDIDIAVGIDSNSEVLSFARKTIPLFPDKSSTQFFFLRGDITDPNWSPSTPKIFKAILACYIWPWVSDKLPQVIENLAASLEDGGHLIIMGEFPDIITPSPFREYAKINKINPAIASGVQIEVIEEQAEKLKLKLIDKKFKLVSVPYPEYRHQMYGAVFKKVK